MSPSGGLQKERWAVFGYVCANWQELTKEQQERYGAVYCGICRQICARSGNLARLGLRYDMAFLALLQMSLYEPEEQAGRNSCALHPITRRRWVDGPYVQYAADMNVVLAYYNCLDDWQDEGKQSARRLAEAYGRQLPRIEGEFPRQCQAIQSSIRQLSELEKAGCANPDEAAGAFGAMMAELLVCQEDLWAPTLRQMGDALGRFIYLLDAALDYDKDKRKGQYNPYLAMGTGKDWARWEDYLVLTMGRATAAFEKLPLVQDKALLDNILYSGVWVNYRARGKEEGSST